MLQRQLSTGSLTYITFDDPKDAEDALYNLDRVKLFNRELEVEFARGDRKSKLAFKLYSSF